jgi:hypothetical protein
MRRTGIRMTIVGGLLVLVGAVTVLVTHDGSDPARVSTTDQPVPAAEAHGDTAPADAPPSAPTPDRPTGTLSAGAQPVTPRSPAAPPPVTPQQVAELLAGLPLQLEQAASAGGEPRELTPEEVDKIVDDMLEQLGAKP